VAQTLVKKVEVARTKTGWDEKFLRAPSDLATIVASILLITNLGVLAILAVIVTGLIAAIVFT
jgi:hypothetical protein